MWEISNHLQLLGFLRAAALGGIFCFVYDILRGYRRSSECSDFAVFLQDIIYFFVIAPITFCFLLATTNGELRLYIFFGILVGFVLIRLTISKITVLVWKTVFSFFLRILRVIKIGVNTASAFLDRVSLKIATIFTQFFKKGVNTLKKVLKKP